MTKVTVTQGRLAEKRCKARREVVEILPSQATKEAQEMLSITQPAARKLKALLSKTVTLEEPRIRVALNREGIKLVVDRERPGDTTIKHDGESIIVMDTATSDRLYDFKLDVDEGTNRLILKQNEGRREDAPATR
jgi:Fe-S cluster assembly iron-binding protein IscA